MNKKRLFIFKQALALFMVLCSTMGWGQTTIFFENMYNGTGGATGNTIAVHEANDRFNEDGLTYSGTGDMRTTNVSSGYTDASGTWNVLLNSGNSTPETFIIDGINATMYNDLLLSFGVRKSTNAETGSNLTIEYSTTGINGSYATISWPALPTGSGTGSAWHLRTSTSVIPPTVTTIRFSGVNNSSGFNIDDVKLIGTPLPSCTTSDLAFTNTTVSQDLSAGTYTQAATSSNGTTGIFYSSSDQTVATVNAATGEVALLTAGTTTITATQAEGTHNATLYCAGTAMYDLTISSSAPSLVLTGAADHGSACIGTSQALQTYTITNSGNSAAGGLTVISDNTQFVMSNLTATTVPGSSGTVTFDVTFTPTSAGAQNATITVQSSTSGSNVATFDISGTGNPTVNPGVAAGNAVVTNDAATLYGEVTSLGSCLASPIVNRGFVYTVFSSPEINGGTYVNEGTAATGAFSVNVSGLVPAKTYYYKAFVVDAAGHYYYSPTEGTFTTSLATPIATAATNVTPVGFTANWNAVTGAEAYILEVNKVSGSVTPNINVVEWNFEDQNTVADAGVSSNLTKTISTSGTANPTYSNFTINGSVGYYTSVAGWDGGANSRSWNVSFSTSGVTNMKLSSRQRSSNTGPKDFNVQYSLDASTWIDITSANITVANDFLTGVLSNITLPAALENKPLVYLRWIMTSNSSVNNGTVAGTGSSSIDEISIIGDQGTFSTTPVTGSPITVTAPATSYSVTGLEPNNKYAYTVKAVSGSVTSAASNTIEVTTQGAPTWNGTEWSNNNEGPDATTPAIIDGDYNEGAFTAQSLTVNAGKTLTVTDFVSAGDVTNNGHIIVADGANFVQTGTFAPGTDSSFKVRKDTKPVKRLAYINWSSPMAVSTQTLKDFSYGKNPDGSNQSATGTVDNRFFTYNNNTFVSIVPTTTFEAGAGYQIRTPNDFTTTPQVFHGQFEGTRPNSGTVSYDHSGIGGDYVLLGNPYPSAISIDDFLTANPGTQETIYIWNSEAEMIDNAYGGGNYNTYAPNTGSVPAGSINGYIPVGQGFFIERGTAAAPFVFNNAMRQTTEDGVFSKAATADKFWLELTVPSGSKPQMLIGFNAAATADYDAGFDAALFGTNADALYSEVNGTKLVIDAHGTFSSDDTFALKADLSAAGNYTMGILKSEGVFASGQQIWLKDQLTGTTTLISEQPYSFSADAGTLANRFVLQFKPGGALATDSAVKSDIRIYSAGSEVHATASENITSLHVYDMSGRMIAKAPAAQKEIVLNVAYKGVVLVKAQLANGTVKTTKLMLK